ncbi:MAG: hypothetical protein BWX84_01419 [Verrucomicrobia bacterium ADurb.Bin118]|nr:MAG: hypothetical protein BWX84_01419 [Verrucomicrobia bacterium ADurb.Bin118]
MLGKLFGERTVRERGFAKDQDAAGFLVEPVQDGQSGPTRLAVF